MFGTKLHSHKFWGWGITATGLIAVLLLATGCSGGGMNAGQITGVTPAATQLKIGDAPADRVVSFEVSVGPITLTPTSGSPVTVLTNPRRVELTHLSGTSEPLALLNIPQGSYNSMQITVSNPEVTFLNSTGTPVELKPPFNQAITINFSPAITISPSASVLNIDLNVANSLTFDAQGNVTGVSLGAASFTVTTSAVAGEDQQEDEDGELEDTVGMVTAVNGNSFTLTVGQNGASLTLTTDANTEFDDGATLATLLNMIVKVEGVTRPDGTLYAKEAEGIENNNGAELEGLVNQVTGNPATQFTLVAQDGTGNGVTNSQIGTPITINVAGAQYRVNQGKVDTSGIGNLPSAPNFPFDATTIHAGQRVEVESSGGMAGTAFTAEKVKLDQQALKGTVSGLQGATSAGPVTFTLTVPSDSAFAMLSGQTTVKVFWQPGTDLHNLASVNNGNTVRVRGLVFFTGTSFNMIARRIDQ